MDRHLIIDPTQYVNSSTGKAKINIEYYDVGAQLDPFEARVDFVKFNVVRHD